MTTSNNPFRTQSQLDERVLPVDIDENPWNWRSRAHCRTKDPQLFHPAPSDDDARDKAKAICTQCPVAQACLDWALINDTRHAIYAGYEPHERRRIAINTAHRAARATSSARK